MTNKRAFHEDISRKQTDRAGSDRSFGGVFTVVFTFIGVFPLWHDDAVRVWALAIAGLILAVTIVHPRLLAPANRLWFRIGMLLGAIVAPIVMMLVFLVAVTPTACVIRMLGKDPLRLKFDSEARTYWLHRDPPGPDPETMTRQF